MSRRTIRRDAAGVGVAVGAYGVAFGAGAVTAGLTPLQACALSLLMFTGGSQFALVGVIGGGGTAAAGTASALLLGSRNTLYAVRLAPLLSKLPWPRRLVAAQGIIDETTAMATAQPDAEASRTAFWATFLAVYSCWNLATLAGAYGAKALGDPADLGLDAAVAAAFLALLAPRLRLGRVERAVALGGAAIALGLTPVLTPGAPILLAGLAAVAGWAWTQRAKNVAAS